MSVFMWVVVSSESSVVVPRSMSIGLNLEDNGICSFISLFFFFCLVWIFPFLKSFS